MKKLLILVCSLAVSAAAFAAPTKSTHPAVSHMSGTISNYDAATRTLTIRHDKNKETTFQINDQSAVMKGKSKADASSLATSTGQPAKVEYVMNGSNRIAEKVDVEALHVTAAKKK